MDFQFDILCALNPATSLDFWTCRKKSKKSLQVKLKSTDNTKSKRIPVTINWTLDWGKKKKTHLSRFLIMPRDTEGSWKKKALHTPSRAGYLIQTLKALFMEKLQPDLNPYQANICTGEIIVHCPLHTHTTEHDLLQFGIQVMIWILYIFFKF